jgi:hypothetical protein
MRKADCSSGGGGGDGRDGDNSGDELNDDDDNDDNLFFPEPQERDRGGGGAILSPSSLTMTPEELAESEAREERRQWAKDRIESRKRKAQNAQMKERATRILATSVYLANSCGILAKALSRHRARAHVIADCAREAACATVVQAMWRRHKAMGEWSGVRRFAALWKKHAWRVRFKLRSRRRLREANLVQRFVRRAAAQSRFSEAVRLLLWRILKCQALVRGFLACNRARREALTRAWTIVEGNTNMRAQRDEVLKRINQDKTVDEKAVDEARERVSDLMNRWRWSFKKMVRWWRNLN